MDVQQSNIVTTYDFNPMGSLGRDHEHERFMIA